MSCCMKQRLFWRNNLQDLTQRKKGLVSKCAIWNCASQHHIDKKPTSLRALSPPPPPPTSTCTTPKGIWKWSFSKTRSNLKTPALRCSVDSNFENKAFWERHGCDKYVISLTEFSWNTNPKSAVIVAFRFKFFRRSLWEIFDAFSELDLRFQIPPA